jgi:membrane protease YdiL (CAAX protease family)
MVAGITMICAAILLFAAGFHLYWGCGGRVGSAVALPQRADGTRVFQPSPAGAILVALFLVGVLVLVLALAGVASLPIPPRWLRIGAMLLSMLFLARALSWYRYVGFFKSIRNTRFAKYDTWMYCPLCLLLSLGLMAAAILFSPE